ncbi:restriction endonuclease subunit S [uncultured Clostridium sp.]|uniref:restriction endonuclease subunit S n=1 Tax=uncultured Clostridium sp. TaxID=59620 RepID=UPI00280BA9E1|nr:restriction endonuclease subunit S [uncultured Clostridium sp.]MDU1348227.1 restriction endonuclease subunit S [Clostridium argentinense]
MFGDPVLNTKNWDMKILSEVGSLGRGVSKHRPRNAPELLGGDYPLIQTGDVANAVLYIKEYNSTYSELGLKQSKLWEKGTLCITIAANIAKTGILTFDACFPDSVVGFVAGDKTNNIFMYYWFSLFQKLLEDQAPESAQKNINLKILGGLKVIVPPIELQNQFADFVKQVDKLKFEMEKSLKIINYFTIVKNHVVYRDIIWLCK